jgi:hypothetical protein
VRPTTDRLLFDRTFSPRNDETKRRQGLKRLTDGEESNAFTSLAWTRLTASAENHTINSEGFSSRLQCMISPLTQPDVNEKNARNKRHRKDGEVPFWTGPIVRSLNTYVVPCMKQNWCFPQNRQFRRFFSRISRVKAVVLFLKYLLRIEIIFRHRRA